MERPVAIVKSQMMMLRMLHIQYINHSPQERMKIKSSLLRVIAFYGVYMRMSINSAWSIVSFADHCMSMPESIKICLWTGRIMRRYCGPGKTFILPPEGMIKK